jgi:oligoribonuclease NrnB/cAMP/cGMP phosphodiesterase (DHH superfamily)
MTTPRTLIMYHGNCPDGFGGAYAAWKKYGDAAEYIPLSRGEEAPEGIDGAEVYLIDFTYTRDIMDDIVARAASVVVLDHHDGVREIVEAMPSYVFDNDRSGATIAWNYFHPGLPTPLFLKLLEDQDLFRHELPETVPLHAYLEVHPSTFELWDELVRMFDDPAMREVFLEKARAYAEYFELLAEIAVNKAKLVMFEGYEIYFATCHPFKSLKSLVGNKLAKKRGPVSLVVSAHPNGYGVSIRGDGSVNVAHIAQKFGGNGHPNSSGFLIPRSGPFPWELVEDTEE